MSIFTVLDNIDSFLWTFLGVPIVIILGLYLSFKEKFYQLRQAGSIAKTIYSTQDKEDTAQNKQGIHPLKLFTSIGGWLAWEYCCCMYSYRNRRTWFGFLDVGCCFRNAYQIFGSLSWYQIQSPKQLQVLMEDHAYLQRVFIKISSLFICVF